MFTRLLNIKGVIEMCGIYMIKNNINGKMYIGQSKNINTRWIKHKTELNANRHANRHLQGSWNKYGSDSFSFLILEECLEDELNKKEQYYIEFYDSFNTGYNLDKGGNGVCGFKHTPEQLLKMRRIQSPLIVLQFDFNFNLVYRFEGGSSHARKEFGYSKDCIDRCCKHEGRQIHYKDSYWVYEDEYLHNDFSWDKYLKQISCVSIKRNKKNKENKKICQYTKNRELIKIWDSFTDIESAGFIRSQVNTICNKRRGKKTHRGYIWTYEDYNWEDGYFDNLEDAYKESIESKRKKIKQLNDNKEGVHIYNSLIEAALAMNLKTTSCIVRAAKNGKKSAGYFWEYADKNI